MVLLWIFGGGALLGGIWAIYNRQSVGGGVATGLLLTGNCLLQLLVPAVLLLIGLWLLRLIFS